MTRLFTILAPIVVFGIIVFVHELGHFLAAKLTGVYAPRFSVGFGPALFRHRRGETEYVLAALPLGGYVRMASREDEAVAFLEGGAERAPDAVPTTGGNAAGKAVDDHAGAPHRGKDWDPDAMLPFGPKPVPEHRWFESKSLVARLFILLAGVTMNVLLAYVINTGFALARGRPYRPAVVDSVLAGRPAAAAGMLPGDSVVAVNGQAVRTWGDVLERVEPVTRGQVTLRVARRTGEQRDLVVTPVAERGPDPATGVPRTVGRIGVMARPTDRYEPLSPGAALAQGGKTTWLMASSVGATLRGLFAGDVSVKNLGGPIAIARTSVQVARLGWEPLLGLIALMSVNIAVLNLLPIPVLDGGQVLVNVLEAIKGSAFSARTREYILRAGLAAVALLFVTVMWNDIARLVGDVLGR